MRRFLGLVVAGLLAACGGNDDASSPATVPNDPVTTETTAATSTSSTTSLEDVEAAVEQAYYAQWDALIEILGDPDVTNPLIDRYFTGAIREEILDTLSEDISRGYATRLPEDPSLWHVLPPKILDLEKASATLLSCHIDGLVLYLKDTGAVVNDDVSTSLREQTYVLEDGLWKLASASLVELIEGVGGCALDS